MGKNSEFKKAREKLEEEMMRSRSMLKQLSAHCTHQKKNGQLDLSVVDNDKQIFRCNQCKQSFGISIRPKEEIVGAVDILIDILNQIKSLSSDEMSEKYIKRLGDIIGDLEEVPKLYNTLVIERGRSSSRKSSGRSGSNRKFGISKTNIY